MIEFRCQSRHQLVYSISGEQLCSLECIIPMKRQMNVKWAASGSQKTSMKLIGDQNIHILGMFFSHWNVFEPEYPDFSNTSGLKSLDAKTLAWNEKKAAVHAKKNLYTNFFEPAADIRITRMQHFHFLQIDRQATTSSNGPSPSMQSAASCLSACESARMYYVCMLLYCQRHWL